MAVRTSFTLAECFFELAKKHREMDQESLARREIGHARKLLAEALATHRDEELTMPSAGELGAGVHRSGQERCQLPMYRTPSPASPRSTDYPESEFAAKAQYKTAPLRRWARSTTPSKSTSNWPISIQTTADPMVMSRLEDYFEGSNLRPRQAPREKPMNLRCRSPAPRRPFTRVFECAGLRKLLTRFPMTR